MTPLFRKEIEISPPRHRSRVRNNAGTPLTGWSYAVDARLGWQPLPWLDWVLQTHIGALHARFGEDSGPHPILQTLLSIGSVF